MFDNDEKTEEPTSKKLSESHAKGQFAKAEEIAVVAVIMAVFCLFLFTAKDRASEIAVFAKQIFSHLPEYNFTQTESAFLIRYFIQFGLQMVIWTLGACLLAVLVAGGIQSGFKLTQKALSINIEKLNPVNGLKKIFSMKNVVDLGVDSLKLFTIAIVIYNAFLEIKQDPVFYAPVPLNRIPELLLRISLLLLSKLIFILGFIALVKYVYEKHSTHQKLKMTKDEVKEEGKQMYGNPEIKAAQKKLAKRLIQKQMMDKVPTADVVITNPTHYAVALKYERGKDKAPIVLAKGENLLAQKIKEIAKFNGVPTVENKLTARILFKLGAVGKPIPVEVYELVAEILAYVYRTHKYYFYELKKRRNIHTSKKL